MAVSLAALTAAQGVASARVPCLDRSRLSCSTAAVFAEQVPARCSTEAFLLDFVAAAGPRGKVRRVVVKVDDTIVSSSRSAHVMVAVDCAELAEGPHAVQVRVKVREAKGIDRIAVLTDRFAVAR